LRPVADYNNVAWLLAFKLGITNKQNAGI